MDENEYRDIYHSVNSVRCCFEKAMLTRRFGCINLVKINIADREAAGCKDEDAQEICKTFRKLIRQNAAFALKCSDSGSQLPHAKEIKAQCGGIIGLYHAMHDNDEIPTGVTDIFACIQDAIETYKQLELFPFPEIIKVITHFRGRPKRTQKNNN